MPGAVTAQACATVSILGHQRAAVRARDASRNRQAEPEATVLGSEEGLEDAVELIGGAPRPAVADDELRAAVVSMDRGDGQLALRTRRVAHRVAGVGQQVEHQLLQLHAVAVDLRQVGRQAGAHVDIARHELAVQELQHVVHDMVQLGGDELLVGLFHQQAQMVDQLPGPLVGLDDLRQDGADLRDVGRVVRQKALRRLGIAQDGGQRLVQLVGERARELGERGHPRQMGQLHALLALLHFGLPPCRDVAHDADGTGLALQVHRLDAHQGLPGSAGAVAQRHLHVAVAGGIARQRGNVRSIGYRSDGYSAARRRPRRSSRR